MTAQPSISKGKFRTYFFYKLSKLRGKLVAACILSLFSYPMMALAVNILYDGLMKRHTDSGNIPNADLDMQVGMMNATAMLCMAAGIVCIAVLFIEGFFVVKSSFRSLYDKKYIDMDLSLPVSDNTRFAADILSGSLIYVVPQIAAVVIGRLVLIHSYGFSEESFYSDYTGIMEFIETGSIFMVCGSVMQFFFTLMIMSFCGRKLTANIVPILFGVGVPVTIIFLAMIVNSCAYGIEIGNIYGYFSDSFILQCSPLGMCLSVFFISQQRISELAAFPIELVTLLYSAAFCAASWFMIKRRRAERTGSAFVYKGGRYAVQFMILLASASVIFLPVFDRVNARRSYYAVSGSLVKYLEIPAAALVITWVIVNIVLFVVTELVCREKLGSPKKLAFMAARFIGSGVLSVLICYGLSVSDGLGTVGYVPEVSQIEGVQLMDNMPRMVYGYNDHYVSDEESLRLITDFHRRIIEERPDFKWVYDDSYADEYRSYVHFSLDYRMKNGSRTERSYFLPKEYAHDAISLLFSTRAFADNYKLETDDKDALVMVPGNDGVYYASEIPYNEFAAALYKDALETTYEDICVDGGQMYKTLEIIYSNDNRQYVIVSNTFTDTVELMNRYNCNIFDGVYDDAVKFYMMQYTSEGSFTADIKYDYTADENGYMMPTLNYDIREITAEQANELLPHTATTPVYEESRDIYEVFCVYEYKNGDGSVYYVTNNYTGPRFVAEKQCDRAAEIYNAAEPAGSEDIQKYLPEYYRYREG